MKPSSLDLLAVRSELQREIRDVGHRLVRWAFAFWVTQFAAAAALLKLVR